MIQIIKFLDDVIQFPICTIDCEVNDLERFLLISKDNAKQLMCCGKTIIRNNSLERVELSIIGGNFK